MKLKSFASATFKFLFAFGLIAWMITNGMLDLSSLSVLAKPSYFIISFAMVFLTIVVNNVRWTLLLRMQDFRISNRQTLPLGLIGIFFNFAFPGGVGGDVIKGYYLHKRSGGKKTTVAMTLLMDRLMGMLGMVLVAAAIILVEYSTVRDQAELHILSIGVVGLFVLMAVFFALAFSESIKAHPLIEALLSKIPGGSILQGIYDAIHGYRNKPVTLLQTLMLSFLSQFTIIFFVWFFAEITGAPPVPFSVYLFIVPLGLISTVLPVTPAGVGVGQAAIYYLYKLYTGIDSQIGPNALTAYQVILLCWGLLGAYFYVMSKKRTKREAVDLVSQ